MEIAGIRSHPRTEDDLGGRGDRILGTLNKKCHQRSVIMPQIATPTVCALATSVVTGCILISSSAIAQVIPDRTLPTTVTSPNGLNFTIDGGSRSGTNLFHSFGQFSVPTGGSAVFNNAIDIQNIFSRVTGGTASNINGMIQANGSANLFLLNPSGILFGPNASLNIGGSFVGTTANSIKFGDGVEFSAVNANGTPLLTMSVPIGLQMGQNPGAIALQGSGHRLTTQNPLLSPFLPTVPHLGLAVIPGRTLALVGGDINLNGGVLTAPSGRIELASLKNGSVALNSVSLGYQLSYPDNQEFMDIWLNNRSLLDVNLLKSGSVQIQGRDIYLRDGSSVWVQNRSDQPSGDIQVNASRQLMLVGISPDFQVVTNIITEALSSGSAGQVNVTAPNLLIDTGATIRTRAYQASAGGDINVTSQNLIVKGYVPLAPRLFSGLGTLTFSDKAAGNLTINTRNLSVLESGYIGSTTIGSGKGGNVLINADRIDVNGFNPSFVQSTIAGSTIGLGGDAGTLTINTGSLSVTNQGLVVTSSIGVGSAGNLTINALDSIIVNGRHQGDLYGSSIASTVDFPNLFYQQQFGLPRQAIGNSGRVKITTSSLKILDAGISSSNADVGNSGIVSIKANEIYLSSAEISASASTGNGGNLEIQAEKTLLRRNSFLGAAARGGGNGGNISLNSPIILGLENSDIIANAIEGRGGNITLFTQIIIGLELRDTKTPRIDRTNDITASSEIGINGTVKINGLGLDPSSGLTALPSMIDDASQKISQDCAAMQGSSFSITGRGGIPSSPARQGLGNQRPWLDLRDRLSNTPIAPIATTQTPSIPIEATALSRNPQTGNLELIAATPIAVNPNATCAIAYP
jgi:filamentous hemagglutinin family protein